jgi:hypothetical protein
MYRVIRFFFFEGARQWSQLTARTSVHINGLAAGDPAVQCYVSPGMRFPMTPAEQKQLIEYVKKVKNWLEEHNASPAVRELILRDMWDPEIHPEVLTFLKGLKTPISKPKLWRIRDKNPDIP